MGDHKLPVGVSVLLTCNGHVLLGERLNCSAAGLLSTPGGRIEEDETLLSCARREAFEETDLLLPEDELEVVAWCEHFRYDSHYFMFYVHHRLPGRFTYSGYIKNKEPDKCKGWEWRKIDSIDRESTTEPLEILRTLDV